MPMMRLKPAAPRSRIKHSNAEPPRSSRGYRFFLMHTVHLSGRIQYVALKSEGVFLYFLAHQLEISAVFTDMRNFYLTYPVLTCWKDKNHLKTSEVIVMLKRNNHVMSHLSIFKNIWEPFLKHKMWYLMVRKKKIPLFV